MNKPQKWKTSLVMIWAAMSSAGVGPLFWSPQSTQHLPGHFRALHASFCWQALWRCWFHFPAGLGTCPHCQRYQKLVQWPCCYCAWLASKLAWPEPHRESMGYGQEEDETHQTQQCRWPEGRYQSNLVFITPEQCHRLIASFYGFKLSLNFIFVNCNNYAFCIVFKHCNVAFCHFCYWKTTVCG